MSTTDTNPGSKSSMQIEGEVEQTRGHVADTLSALRGKLEPSQIVDEVVDRISGYAKGSGAADFARNLGVSVRDNPMPVALIAAGIGWLLLSKGGSGSAPANGSYRDDYPRRSGELGVGLSNGHSAGGGRLSAAAGSVRDGASAVSEKAGDVASGAMSYVRSAGAAVADGLAAAKDQVTETAGSLASSASGAASRLSDGVDSLQDRASTVAEGATDRLEKLIETQPLLTGVLGLTLGVALGALLPRTRTEDRLMGEASDAVVQRISTVAQDSYQDIRGAVGEEVDKATAAVAETYTRTKEQLDAEGISQAGETLGAAASQVIQSVGEAVTGVADQVTRKVETAGAPPPAEPAPPTRPA